MEKKVKHIIKLVYCFSLLTWIANICFIIASFFFEISRFWIIGIFCSILIQGVVSGAFSDERIVPKTTKKYKAIDCCLFISKYISSVLAAVGFISLLIGGGRPEVVNGKYCIVNHGDIVRHISDEWFAYFTICEMVLFICGILYFSTYMTLRIRTLYLIQQQ